MKKLFPAIRAWVWIASVLAHTIGDIVASRNSRVGVDCQLSAESRVV